MNIIVREAVPDDAAQMLALVRGLAEEPDIDIPLAPGEFTLTLEEERAILAEYAAAENAVFLVAEHDERIVGTLDCKGGKRSATRHAATLGISVSKDWRGKGAGNALLTQAIAWARATGVLTRIELAVYARNARAIHLYEKHGFVLEGCRKRAIFQYGEYLDDLIMALLL